MSVLPNAIDCDLAPLALATLAKVTPEKTAREGNAMSQRSNRKKPYNWLKRLDEAAANFPVAENWEDYDCFVLTHHPQLQPRDPGDVVGRRAYEERLRDQEELISSNSSTRQVLRKLSPEQRREVSALVYDLTVELKQHVKWKQMPEEMVQGTGPLERLF